VPNAPATVLVVDDEETICEIVTRTLQDVGLVCVTAHTAEAALEWLRIHPWPDLFIVDVRLPGMSGQEFVIGRCIFGRARRFCTSRAIPMRF
jgi:CheY-like chemotaxis protein